MRIEGPELTRLAAAGITSVLATPGGNIFRGQSALVNVVAPPDDPQIGSVADIRRTMTVVEDPVALHVNFSPGGGPYPASLMGAISFVRQSFMDARVAAAGAEVLRKEPDDAASAWDPALNGLLPAIDRQIPVAFQADQAREIARVLQLAKELKLRPMITGGRQADEMAADLKAANAPVIYSLNYPTRPRTLPPGGDEPLATLRARANAPKIPGALAKAGVALRVRNRRPRAAARLRAQRRARRHGRPAGRRRAPRPDARRREDRRRRQSLGSLDKGKIANVIVTSGDLFAEATRIRYVFVDGRMVNIEGTTRQPDAADEDEAGSSLAATSPGRDCLMTLSAAFLAALGVGASFCPRKSSSRLQRWVRPHVEPQA